MRTATAQWLWVVLLLVALALVCVLGEAAARVAFGPP